MPSPLDDPRASDLLSAQPDDVHAVAANFAAAAHEATLTAAGLTAAREDGVWTGHAATSFRQAVGRMPSELDRVRSGYAAVADALRAYEPELARIQSDFTRVIAALESEQTQLQLAQATAQEARDAIVRAGAMPRFDPRAARADELAAARADGVVGRHTADIAALRARAYALLDAFETVRDTCRAAVAAAQRTAPVDPDPGRGRVILGPGGRIERVARVQARVVARDAASAAQAQAEQHEEQRRVATMLARAEAMLTARSTGAPGSAAEHVAAAAFAATIIAAGASRLRDGRAQAAAADAELDHAGELKDGAGRRVTIYSRAAEAERRALIDIDGAYFESSAGRPPFRHPVTPTLDYLGSFDTVRHPAGL